MYYMYVYILYIYVYIYIKREREIDDMFVQNQVCFKTANETQGSGTAHGKGQRGAQIQQLSMQVAMTLCQAIEHAKWERWDEMFEIFEIFDVYPGEGKRRHDATNTLELFVATLAIVFFVFHCFVSVCWCYLSCLWRPCWWLSCKLQVVRICDLSSANMLLDSQMLCGIVETERNTFIWGCHTSHLCLNLTEEPAHDRCFKCPYKCKHEDGVISCPPPSPSTLCKNRSTL